MSEERYVVAVDPGTNVWGYCVFTEDLSEIVEYETVTINPKLCPEKRLYELYKKVDEILYKYPASILLTEQQFDRYTDLLIKAQGVIETLSGKWGVEVRRIAPSSWKKYALDNYKADKEEGVRIIKTLYPELVEASEHICDAVAFVEAYKKFPNIAKKKMAGQKHGKTDSRGKRKTS